MRRGPGELTGRTRLPRWLLLGAYAALIYGLVPYGPALGRTVLASEAGRYALGRGAIVLVLVGAVASVARLRSRGASARAYALVMAAVLGCALALGWLREVRLERVHLPEYGIASVLAWWALVPSLGDRVRTYVVAVVLAALIGWGDELVQSITPGRVYDLRDVAANAVGASLGATVLATWRAGTPKA
jgi:hypothetical protein